MSSKDRAPINLVALGSAAVLSVYAAGYARTLPAAQRLAAEDAEERRPPRPVAIVEPMTPTPVIVSTSASVAKPAPKTSPKPDRVSEKRKIDSRPAVVATAPTPPATPVADSAKPIAAAPASAPAPAPVPTTAPADTAQKPAENEPVHYKDGTFFGWGTSRHGDIQMGIEIKGGVIKSAFISECNTQYDCSWIFQLPKQVVARQSAEVDYVSGATHSANALYRAVVNALKQAQAK